MPGKLNRRYAPAFLISLCASGLLALGLLTRPLLRAVVGASAAATITVNTTADDNTVNGNCTLREAIEAANTDTAVDACTAGSGTDTIAFAIPGAGPHTINLTSQLPEITAPIIIDGTTQPGASCTAAGGLKIELNGENSGGNGLVISAGGSTVKGLVINRFPGTGVILSGGSGNTLSCNYIGTNVAGDAAQGNADFGVYLANSANNLIGGATAGAGNLISGNTHNGVEIEFALSTNNRVQGNTIGTNAAGTAALGNESGIGVAESAANNFIGGAASGEGNLVSGNHFIGVGLLSGGGNSVQGNRIGTDVTGTLDLGNGDRGVFIVASTNNLIGGTTVGARNLISGNDSEGVRLEGSGASGNRIEGNYIGLNLGGTAAIPNALGIAIGAAQNNVIGGTSAGARNVISGNTGNGIQIDRDNNAANNRIEGNYIGTDITGALDLGNGGIGVFLFGAQNNVIGGTASAARNVISGNNNSGIVILNNGSALASGNRVEGNYIGTNANGSADLGNTFNGLQVSGPNTVIGGTAAGAGNVISGNDASGLFLTVNDNRVEGNIVGLNASGTAAVGNSSDGIQVSGPNSVIGGTALGARNLISGNTQSGVVLSSSAGNARLEGNYIGTDVTGALDLGNLGTGVTVSAANLVIGGTAAGAGNLISGNDANGILISGAGNRVEGNRIGTDVNGMADLGNRLSGVVVLAANNLIGGLVAGARNLISGNDNSGVLFSTASALGNVVQGNYIGTDVSGTLDLGNTQSGVSILGAPNNTIGGATAPARNVISGNNFHGVAIGLTGPNQAATTSNLVLGNFIGTDASGTASVGNSIAGVFIRAPGNRVGGTAPGEPNLIAFNAIEGVRVLATATDTATGNAILGNAIFSNGVAAASGLGIELTTCSACPGVTANDAGDGDTGPNKLQNFPVLSAATLGVVTGTLNSAANKTYRLEFFGNTACDAAGYGEGEVFLGALNVTTDAAGDVSFTTPALPITPGKPYVTATATDPDGNTSEFSTCVLTTFCPVITLPALPDGTVGQLYNQTVVASPSGYTYSYSLSGTLPVGLSFNNGVLSGTPVQTDSFTFTITAGTSGGACTGTQNYTLTINCPTIIVSPSTLPLAQLNTAYPTQSFTATGGNAPYTFSHAGALPMGMSFSSGGVLAGTPTAPGNYSLTINVTDSYGCTASRNLTLMVNRPPVAACQNVTVTADATCSATADINNGSSDADGDTLTITQAPAGPYAVGTHTVTLTVDDGHGGTSACSATVTVNAPKPAPAITGPASGAIYQAGTPITFTGAFTDLAGATHTASWKFESATPPAIIAAGTVVEPAGATPGSSSVTQSFTTPGVYLVTLTVTNNCGGSGQATNIGADQLSAALTNNYAGLDQAATLGAEQLSAMGTSNYAGLDLAATIGADQLSALIVIYDPGAGFVTGGGWINSPAGAYTADPALTGKANFGFVSKYQNGASVPTGNTEFQFKAGNLNFSSTVYEWMVIAGARAQYKGSGKINNAGDYRFMLTAIDGQQPGGGGADKFRIRIWNNAGGGLVYDNQMNAGDNADPTTVLGGGSIVIHK